MPRWDSASKNKQRLLIQQQQPWQKSTGPRSEYGRLVSSRNALKKKCSFLTDVSSMSQEIEGDIDQPLEVGDFAVYVGSDPMIASVCSGKKLEVFALCEGWVRCWVPNFPGLITVPIGELLQHG